MGNQAHPGECKPWKVGGLQRAERVASSTVKLEAFPKLRHETVPNRKE